jgi:hypothetical protein
VRGWLGPSQAQGKRDGQIKAAKPDPTAFPKEARSGAFQKWDSVFLIESNRGNFRD